MKTAVNAFFFTSSPHAYNTSRAVSAVKAFLSRFLDKTSPQSPDFSQEILTSLALASQAGIPRLIPPLYKGAIVFSEHNSSAEEIQSLNDVNASYFFRRRKALWQTRK
jgi:hypothetical protein